MIGNEILSPKKAFPFVLGAYYCLNMGMIATSTFLCTIVVHIYFRGNGPMPIVLRKVCLRNFVLLIRKFFFILFRFFSNGLHDSFVWFPIQILINNMQLMD
jgi:hypothetical protein